MNYDKKPSAVDPSSNVRPPPNYPAELQDSTTSFDSAAAKPPEPLPSGPSLSADQILQLTESKLDVTGGRSEVSHSSFEDVSGEITLPDKLSRGEDPARRKIQADFQHTSQTHAKQASQPSHEIPSVARVSSGIPSSEYQQYQEPLRDPDDVDNKLRLSVSNSKRVSMEGAVRVRGVDYTNGGEESGEFSCVKSASSAESFTPIQAHVVEDDDQKAWEEQQRLTERVATLERQLTTSGATPLVSAHPVIATVHVIEQQNTNEEPTRSSLMETAPASADAPSVKKRKCCCGCCAIMNWWWVGFTVFAITAIMAVTIVLYEGKTSDGDTLGDNGDIIIDGHDDRPIQETAMSTFAPTPSPTTPLQLDRIRQRGYINCRVESFERRRGYGFSLDLCRALSAAIFDGDWNRTGDEWPVVNWGDQWALLTSGELDVSTSQATFTMERDVLEPSIGTGLAFTSAYLYTGAVFGGYPDMVACAEAGESLMGNCHELVICVIEDSTTKAVVQNHLDGSAVHLVVDSIELFDRLVKGDCNVLAGDPSLIYEERVREAGFEGDYVFGEQLFSKEPLAMVTRDSDPQWADFCQWLLTGLVAAEAFNITQDRAGLFPLIDAFGPSYRHMMVHAIAAVGNYGELYEQHLQERFPRAGMNQVYMDDHSSGLHYAYPFGDLNVEEVLGRDPPSPVANGTIARIEELDRIHCAVLKKRPWLGIEDENVTTVTGLDVALCRVLSAALFHRELHHVEFVFVDTMGDGFVALADHAADVFVSAEYSLANDVHEPTTGMGYTLTPPYFYSNTSAYALATRQGDIQWSNLVRWVLWSTIFAEEEGIGSDRATELPTVDLFGPKYMQLFRHVNVALGNFGDIYNNSQEGLVPRTGRNELNRGGGPQLQPWLDWFS